MSIGRLAAALAVPPADPVAEERVVEFGTVELLVSAADRDCLCCPTGSGHVFGYRHRLDGDLSSDRRHRTADDIVRDLLRRQLLVLGSEEPLQGRRIRVTVELLGAAPSAP